MDTIINYTDPGNTRWIVYENVNSYTAALMLGTESVPVYHKAFPNLTQALHHAGVTEPVDGVIRYVNGKPMEW